MFFRSHIRLIRSAMLIGALSLAAALALSGCQRRGRAPERLRILFTSGTQGTMTPVEVWWGPRGGMAQRATAIAEARANAPGQVILIDTGNFTSGTGSDLDRTQAAYVTQAMALMDYDAVNVGALDARTPRSTLIGYTQEGCPLTSSAYTYEDEESGERLSSYPSRIVLELQGFRIAVIGSPLDDLEPENFGQDNEPTVTRGAFTRLLDDVYLDDNVGMVILISEMSHTTEQAHFIASQFSMATLVIAGAWTDPEHEEDGTAESIDHPLIIPSADDWGRTLGVLDLDLSPSGGIIAYRLRFVDLNEGIDEDPAIAALTQEYIQTLNQTPPDVPVALEAGFASSEACSNCHIEEYESWADTRHADAWTNLAAIDRLSEAGCIPCHATGYTEVEHFPSRLVPEELQGVGCESCHGPGEAHVQYRRWRMYGEPIDEDVGEDPTDSIVPNPPETTCLRCHTWPYDEGWFYGIKLDRIRHE